MKGLRKYLSPFAPDQSGAAAVLCEFHGLIIILDAGGCAGNICGFDEPRWFESRSAIFSAGLRDMDAILGRDDRLVAKLVDAADKIDANFAAIVGTPVPAVIGTDYQALKRMCEKKTDLPILAIDTDGMELYDKGEEKAYLALFTAFAKEKYEVCKEKVGILGMTPQDVSDLKAADKVREELKKEGVSVERGTYLPYALTISHLNYLGKLAAFRQGKFAVQDESSQLAVEVADINEGDFVLDVCAAPGGKTFHAADRLHGTGKVLSRDLTEYKTDLIEENKDRMCYENVEVQQWDALVEDESLLESVDVLLADLPCSGLGIMGRKNDIKYQMTQQQLSELAQLQRNILSVIWKYVKPGGEMIFSTCTLNRGENIENIRWIEENTPMRLVSIEDYLPETLKGRTGSQGYLQLIPGKDSCDGFFISKFERPEAR